MAFSELRSVFTLFLWINISSVNSSPLEQMNFFVNQNRYIMQPSTFQTKFSIENVIRSSIDLALQSCKADFKWERWNCPTADFFTRRTTAAYFIDREDAYVRAITTAAAIYTIAKECASGVFKTCGCGNPNSILSKCSDDPDKAADLFTEFMQVKFSKNFRGHIEQHNFKVVTTLLKQSLIRQCGCTSGDCSEENCVNVLLPFSEIATELKLMYDEGLQLTNNANTQVMWSNIPMDSLVYARDSPNYCDLDAVPYWAGMSGRQCEKSNDKNNENGSSCEYLCTACGYRVRAQNVVTERNCNCKFTWNFQVVCERCMNVKQQFFCY